MTIKLIKFLHSLNYTGINDKVTGRDGTFTVKEIKSLKALDVFSLKSLPMLLSFFQ